MERSDWDQAYAQRSPLFGRNPTAIVMSALDMIHAPTRVLDLGAGDGRDTLPILRAGHRVDAIDYSAAAISAMEAAVGAAGYRHCLTAEVADLAAFRPKPRSYGLIIGITILDHLHRSAHRALFESAVSSLMPGGILALEMYSDRDPSRLEATRLVASEFSSAIRSVATRNYLVDVLPQSMRINYYSDRLEEDSDHGPIHWHGFQSIIATLEEE